MSKVFKIGCSDFLGCVPKWHFPRLFELVTMRMTAGANAWGKVEEVMVDRHISRKRK